MNRELTQEEGRTGMAEADLAMGGELVTLLKEGVKSGDADIGVPEEMERLAVAGAGPEQLAKALRKAVEKGRISPLLFVRAEELLGMGSADEQTDRSRVVQSRNKLLL